GTLSFGAFAAKEIQKEDVAKMNLTKVGSITTSRTTSRQISVAVRRLPIFRKEGCFSADSVVIVKAGCRNLVEPDARTRV
ncbi:hypothetical protein FK513_30105, partial [Klebsiella pneumoniae]|nr:hypothetical protein [Klebsiella pneumoniae]